VFRTIRRLAAVWLWCALLPAWAVSDFSGTWVLDTSQGENLGMVAAIQETLTIEQTESSLMVRHVAVFQGQSSEREVRYDLSGDATENFAAMGEKSTTVSNIDGDRIVTTWTAEGAIPGTEVVKIETRSLSADGKSMTVSTARENRPTMVLVYQKQS
jgi:hypothetical protein